MSLSPYVFMVSIYSLKIPGLFMVCLQTNSPSIFIFLHIIPSTISPNHSEDFFVFLTTYTLSFF